MTICSCHFFFWLVVIPESSYILKKAITTQPSTAVLKHVKLTRKKRKRNERKQKKKKANKFLTSTKMTLSRKKKKVCIRKTEQFMVTSFQ